MIAGSSSDCPGATLARTEDRRRVAGRRGRDGVHAVGVAAHDAHARPVDLGHRNVVNSTNSADVATDTRERVRRKSNAAIAAAFGLYDRGFARAKE